MGDPKGEQVRLFIGFSCSREMLSVNLSLERDVLTAVRV